MNGARRLLSHREQKRDRGPAFPVAASVDAPRCKRLDLRVHRLITHSKQATEAATDRQVDFSPDAARQFAVITGDGVKYQPCAML